MGPRLVRSGEEVTVIIGGIYANMPVVSRVVHVHLGPVLGPGLSTGYADLYGILYLLRGS
jgi:hypothetical protein